MFNKSDIKRNEFQLFGKQVKNIGCEYGEFGKQ